jgi:RHS repeat-associated protein
VNSGYQTSTSWTVPAAALRDGTTYTWDVYVWDGGSIDGGGLATILFPVWTRKFKVDMRLGAGGPSPTDTVGPATVNLATGNLVVTAASQSLPTVGGSAGVGLTYNSLQASNSGLSAQYFADNGLTAGDFDSTDQQMATRVDSSVNFDWGTGPAWGVGSDNFLVRWQGYITVPTSGTYYFGAISDDGVRIWVNNTSMYTNWTVHSAGQSPDFGLTPTPITLTAGSKVPIKVEYWESAGAAVMKLFANGPAGVGQVPVPASWLTTDASGVPAGWTMSAGDLDAAYTSAKVTDAAITLVSGDGSSWEYKKTSAGGYTPPTGSDDVLSTAADGTFHVAADDGRLYNFTKEGALDSVTSSVDDRTPAAIQYTWTGTPKRLTTMHDPVSNQDVTLSYGGDASCPSLPPGTWASWSAATGLLCNIAFWDGSQTKVFYVPNGLNAPPFLGRVENPGGSITDFGYTNGRITEIRDPLAAEAVANFGVTGRYEADADTKTAIAYDGSGRVQSVTLPAPTAAAVRPQKSYAYDWTSATHNTTVTTAGITPTINVSYDGANRQTQAKDTANLTTYFGWDNQDRKIALQDPAGLKITYVYDAEGRQTDTWGPAPSTYWTSGNGAPDASHVVDTPHSSNAYDEGFTGLAAEYFTSKDLSGVPLVHANYQSPDSFATMKWSANPTGSGLVTWGARMTGEITLPNGGAGTAGDYQFQLNTQLGVRLFIDDQLVVDGWWDPPSIVTTPTGTFHNDTSGSKHRIRVDLYNDNGTGNQEADLRWQPPSGSMTWMPIGQLAPRYNLATSSIDADGKKVATSYSDGSGIGPQFGLPTTVTQDPTGLALATTTTYETPASGFLRPRTKQLPAGATTKSQATDYYTAGASLPSPTPCGLSSMSNQAGRAKITYDADPDTSAGSQSAIQHETVYDAAGRTVAVRTINGSTVDPWTCTTYDSRGRITQVTYPAYGVDTTGRTVSYTYSVSSNPLMSTVTDSSNSTSPTTGKISMTVDLLSRVTSYTDIWNVATTATYDQAGRVASTTQGSQPAITTGYDSYARPTQMIRGGNVLATTSYDTSGRISGYTYASGAGNAGNGTTGVVSYDTLGRQKELTWKTPAASTITSDQIPDSTTAGRSLAGRIQDQSTEGTDANPSGANYTYDAAGRLIDAYSPGHHYTYTFGSTSGCGANTLTAAGLDTNRTAMTDNAASTTYCYDNADRLTSTTATGVGTLAYDSHGNTTSISGETRGYDIADRHLSTVAPAALTSYTRDANDRIVARSSVATATQRATSTTTSGASAVSSIALTKPTGAQVGDVIVAAVTASGAPTVTDPSGWTRVQAQVTGTALTSIAYTHVVAAADPASWTFTLSAAQRATVVAVDYQDVDLTTPVESSGKAGTSTASTSHPAAATTSTWSYRRLVVFTGVAGSTTVTPATGGTELADLNTTGASSVTSEVYDKPITGAGSTGTAASTSAASGADARVSVLLTPKAETQHYSYSATGDTADLTLDASNNVLEATLRLPGGVLYTDRGATKIWSYPNLHGDIAATADNAGAKQGATLAYDPYGNALVTVPDNSNGTMDYGWLGQHERPTEHQDAQVQTIEMGARQYSPQLGRFIEVDPIDGGTGTNDYGYVADPVNRFDLNGQGRCWTCWATKPAKKAAKWVKERWESFSKTATWKLLRTAFYLIGAGISVGGAIVAGPWWVTAVLIILAVVAIYQYWQSLQDSIKRMREKNYCRHSTLC